MSDDLTIPEKMSGYELARRVLDHPSGGVEELLKLSGNGESDWLELKAGMCLLPEDREKGFEQCDLYWHIGTAVLELMNTSGGALIIGIEDKTHDVVPLRENDPNHVIDKRGLDIYLQEVVLKHIWPENKIWKISPREAQQQIRGISPHWSIQDPVPENLLEIRGCQYRNETVAVVLIKPASPAIRIWKNGLVEQIRARKRGEIGGLLEVKGGRQMEDYDKKDRCIETESYAEKFKVFDDKKTRKAELNEKIEQYYKWFENEIKRRKFFDLSCFTPLDASGEFPDEEPEVDFMQTRAIEHTVYLISKDETDSKEDYDEEEEEVVGENVDLLKLMRDKPHIAVLGEPGGGKTTALMRFVMQFHTPGDDNQILAVFIPMGQWLDGGSLEGLLEKKSKLGQEEWPELIKKNRLRLVIDAVNECPDGFRDGAVWNIREFHKKYPQVPLVISARTRDDLRIHSRNLKLNPNLDLPTFTVQPMDQEHQLDYLTSYLKNASQALSLLKRLQKMPGGEEIAKNPMLLRMVVDIIRIKGSLPAGRAGLYHGWIKQWYDREKEKMKEAGDLLPWDFDKALEILSELAFQSRLLGYRDVPMGNVESILQKFGEDCIEKLCQGPVVTRDEGFIRFRHETFQEYLCAEYLINHPDALSLWTRDCPAQWGMPLAYAAELCWPLPEPLWRAAWKIEPDPWFGLAVTDDARMEQAEEFALEKNNPFLLHTLSICALRKEDKNFYFSIDSIIKDSKHWFSNNDQKLGYVISTNESTRKRWLKIELILLCLVNSPEDASIVLNRSITLRQYAGHSIHQTFQNIISFGQGVVSSSFTELLRKFEDRIATETSISSAARLVRGGFASKDDFRDRLDFWIQTASIIEAGQLIAAGLLTKEDFKDKVVEWKKKADPQTAILLIQNDFASKDDFKDKVESWKSKATPEKARNLIRNQLLSEEEIRDEIDNWKLNADPKMASRLIRNDFASLVDFKESIADWKKDADPQLASILVQIGFASKEDFKDKIASWIQDNDPKTARFLIGKGFASEDDFKDKIKQWKTTADPKLANRLMRSGFAILRDFKDRLENWRLEADPKLAGFLIRNGFASKEDFKDKIEAWKLKIGSRTTKRPTRNSAAKDEFAAQLERLIREESIVLKKTFPEVIAQWKHNKSAHAVTQVICDEMALSSNITSNLIPFLKSRGRELDHSDIRAWIKDWIQDPDGFFWGSIVSVPIIGDVYHFNNTGGSEEIDDGRFMTKYAVGDCHGYIISNRPLSNTFFVRITGIKGLVCFGEIVPDSSRKEKGRLDRKFVVCYSAKGMTGLLDRFINTSAANLISLYSNEKMQLDFLMNIPQERCVPASGFPLQLIFIPETPSPSDYVFATDCDVCGGDGVLVCDRCDGDETIKCRECDGSGISETECVKCSGSGAVKCRKCNGSGICKGKQGDSRTCSVCHGARTITCNHCKGSGHPPCDNCNGTGEKPCPVCSGDGIRECAVCEGRSAVFVKWDRKTQQFYLEKTNRDEGSGNSCFDPVKTPNVYLFVEESTEKTIIHGSWDKITSAATGL